VFGEVAGLSEGSAAEVADVRSFIGMYQDVLSEVRRGAEHLPTPTQHLSVKSAGWELDIHLPWINALIRSLLTMQLRFMLNLFLILLVIIRMAVREY
jgi:hypothetical protein